jgi:hypothetical protein
MEKNLDKIRWEEDDLKRNLPIIFFISCILLTPLTLLQLDVSYPNQTFIFYLFNWVVILLFVTSFGIIFRKYFPDRKYAITNDGIYVKFQNKINKYMYKDVKRIRFIKPYFIDIYMKDGKENGFIFKRKSIDDLLNKYDLAKNN